jgi:arginyl-tRNA synthetase
VGGGERGRKRAFAPQIRAQIARPKLTDIHKRLWSNLRAVSLARRASRMSAVSPVLSLPQRLRHLLAASTALAADQGLLPRAAAASEVALDRPKQASHGDLATNLCFSLAKTAGKNPRALAEAMLPLIRQSDSDGLIAKMEVAGPGFVNLHLSPEGWRTAVRDVLLAGGQYGRSDSGGGEKVLLEFVSANPTGPMHVGHGRGAVLGDALARILRAAGYTVSTEYYINNVGNQVAKLGESTWHWLRDDAKRAAALAVWSRGEPVAFPDGFPQGFPEDGYRGAYIAQIADELRQQPALADACNSQADWFNDAAWGQAEAKNPSGRADNRGITVAAWRANLGRIEQDLAVLDIRFDRWFSERALHGLDPLGDQPQLRNAVADCAKRLLARDWAYEEEGTGQDDDGNQLQGKAVFFRGTREDVPKPFRDSKDRVILRGDGRPTYFAADIAYHDDKLGRGFDHLINVLGADHHGYVSRLKGVIHALGDLRRSEGDPKADRWSGERLEVILIQMVALLRDGKPVPMGKRSGEFVTLRDVVDEVTTAGNPSSGRDAVRFVFLTRKADAQLDFDLEVVRRSSMDNPVYYVQYGHARLASILARAAAEGKPLREGGDLSGLELDDERELALVLAEYPEVVARAAKSREPHQLAYYLMDVCRAFHGYYSRHKHDARVISDDDRTTQGRLALVAALKQVIAAGLGLLGVSAPERMAELPEEEA